MNNRLPVGNKEFGISGSQDISILETFCKKLCKSSWEVRENDDSRDMNELSACLITFTGSLYTYIWSWPWQSPESQYSKFVITFCTDNQEN